MTRTVLPIAVAIALLASAATGCAQYHSASPPAVGNIADGKLAFQTNCSTCHGATGVEGGVGPSLRGESRRKDLDATIAWIHHPDPPMPQLYPSPLTATEVVDIASYVQSL
jgi:mono/diheme cytochrome c family protein